MAPLRNRTTRVQNDQDHIVAGLPIRHWRVSKARVGVPPDEHHVVRRSRWPEHPMPRDTHLLSDMSQIMLRMARLPKKQTEETIDEPEAEKKRENEKREKEEALAKGFKLSKWSQMPKGYDAPDLEVLAKRRKGLPATFDNLSSLYTTVSQPAALRPAKVRKTDTDGTVHVYDVMAPVGQVIEGEIPDGEEVDATIVEPAAPVGTIIDGVGIVNADGVLIAQPTPKRKAPPPRRKPKKGGPGRSKRKIIAELGPDGAPLQQPYLNADGNPQMLADGAESGDTPMPDAQDGDEDDESGEEGEIMDEDDERDDGDMSVETTPARPSSTHSHEISAEETATEGRTATHPTSGLRTEIPLDSTPPAEEPTELPTEIPVVSEEEGQMDVEMTITEDVPEVVSEAVPEVVPEIVLETVPEVVPDSIPEVPVVVPEVVSEALPETVPEAVSEAIPEAVLEPQVAIDEPVVSVSIETTELSSAPVLPLTSTEPQPIETSINEPLKEDIVPAVDIVTEQFPPTEEEPPAHSATIPELDQEDITVHEESAEVVPMEAAKADLISEVEPSTEVPPPPVIDDSTNIKEVPAIEAPVEEAGEIKKNLPLAVEEQAAEQPKSPPNEIKPEAEVKDVTMSG